MIIAIKLTAFAVEKTDERFAFNSAAMGAERLLHAYMEPIQRLVIQLIQRINQRFFVKIFLCCSDMFIFNLRSSDDRQKFYWKSASVSVAVDCDSLEESDSDSSSFPGSSFSVSLHIIS